MALSATMIHSIVETKREKPELVISFVAVSPKMILLAVRLKCMIMAMRRLSVWSYTHTISTRKVGSIPKEKMSAPSKFETERVP